MLAQIPKWVWGELIMNRTFMALMSGAALTAMTTTVFAADLSAPYLEPVAVANPWDAFVSGAGGYTWFDADDLGFDSADIGLDDFAAEARASASYQFHGGFGIQTDFVFNYQALDFGQPDGISVDNKNVDLAFHAFYRNDRFLVGAFGQYGFSSLNVGGSGIDTDRYYIGGEAQAYFDRATLYVQGGFQGLDLPFDDEDVDGFFIKGEARYFATDDLKLAIYAGYDTLDVFGTDLDTIHVGGTAEYRFTDTPFSAFLDVEYRSTEESSFDEEISQTRFLAGVKLNLGTQTLFERDRYGATLNPVRPGALGGLIGFGSLD